jgi:nucleoside-diphosphate-sugar epimerase
VGGHLTKALARRDEAVLVLCRAGSVAKLSNLPPNVKVIAQSKEPSVSEFTDLLGANGVTDVYHAATLFTKKHETSQVSELIEANIKLGTYMLEASAVTGVNRVVNFSSVWQLALAQESDAQQTLYSATKEAFLEILKYYSSSYELSVSNFYLNDTYGANDTRAKLIPMLVSTAKDNTAMHIANPAATINLSFVDELVGRVIDIVGEGGEGFKSFELRSREDLQIRQVADIVAEIAEKELNVTFGPVSAAKLTKARASRSEITTIYLDTALDVGIRAARLLV